jgi:hypothetical protein
MLMKLGSEYWEQAEQFREEQIDAVAKELRLGSYTERLREALDRATASLSRDLRRQLGTILTDRLDMSEIDAVLLSFANSVGLAVNGVRSTEALAASMESTRNMLAGMAAGATVSLRDPAQGEGIIAAFGPLITEVQERHAAEGESP